MAGLRGNQASFALAKQTGKDVPNTTYTDRLPFTGGSISPSREVGNLSETDANRDQGIAFLQSFGVEGSPEVYVRDANIHHILEAALGTLGTAATAPNYRHTITPANALSYYSMYSELGGTLFEQFTDCKVSELTISADAGQPLTAALTVMGRKAERLTASPTNTNEVWTLTSTNTPTGGTFTITYNGQTTAAIPYNETAANIATAIVALSNVGVGDIVGAGGPINTTPVTLTAAAAFANKGLNVPTVNGAALTNATNSADIGIVTTTQGATALPTLASGAVYNYNEAFVSLASAVTAAVGSFELTISNNVTTQQTDDAQLYDIVEGLREVTLGFQLIFEDVTEYARFHYGSTTGVDQSRTLPSVAADFTFQKSSTNSIQFTLPDISYQEFPVAPDPGGDPVVVDVRAVANRGASPVVTAVVRNQVAT
jgi:hypothetical protein